MNKNIDKSKSSVLVEGGSGLASGPPLLSQLGKLTVESLNLFLQIWDSPDRTAFVSKPENGPRLSTLEQSGIIRRIGTVGTKQKWQCCFENIGLAEIKFLREVTKL